MKIIILFFIFLLFTITPLKADELNVGAAIMGGLIELDNDDKPFGPLLDWWESVMGPALGVNIKWHVKPLKRLHMELEEGRVHVILVLMRNPEREKIALYPTSPSWASKIPLVVKKESPIIKVDSPKDLYNNTIGYHLGYSKSTFFHDPKLTFDTISGKDADKRNLIKLRIGRTDIVYFTAISRWLDAKSKIGFADELRVLYLPDQYSEKYYDIFSKKTGKQFYGKYQQLIKSTVNISDAQQYVLNNPIRK